MSKLSEHEQASFGAAYGLQAARGVADGIESKVLRASLMILKNFEKESDIPAYFALLGKR